MRRLLLLLPALPLLIAAGDAPAIQISHPWARATPGAAKTGAAYLTLTDHGAADRLIGVSTPAAAMAELHKTIDDRGTMKMRAVDHLTLAPDHPVTLAPGGYHIMLMGLKAPLKRGETFPLTLTFAHAPPMTVTVPVEAIGASGVSDGSGMGGMPGMHH
jgi:periplasmic copper chaperone A